MSVKNFGIYIAYPPAVDLRSEGLGRHLAEFLKSARKRGDIRFVIACPSWTRQNLIELFDSCSLSDTDFEILSPASKPLLLTLHYRYLEFKKKKMKHRDSEEGVRARWRRWKAGVVRQVEKQVVGTRSMAVLLTFGVTALLPFALLLAMRMLKRLAIHLRIWARRITGRIKWIMGVSALRSKYQAVVSRLFGSMEESEAALLHELIKGRKDIAAWYSPAAFWPEFNTIPAPRLTCVPDVVLSDFPVGFSPIGGNRLLESFRKVEKTIDNGQYFVTYSEEIKRHTLMERYGIDTEVIWVVSHGTNRLDDLISVSGFRDDEAATDALCRELFRTSLSKARNYRDACNFDSKDMRFIFYASQFRPNKNVLSLLRAYAHLLKQRYVGHKLILTGDPNGMPEIRSFIEKQHLQNDVLFLHGLSAQELAACYRLADLAVNPSLSEGGCPFTFTEALSVGTPVTMARIPVTQEVITDPELQAMMLFDPYDWRDMAKRIEWSLNHLQLLHDLQKPFYEHLAKRTWGKVVDDYVAILDHISSEERIAPCSRLRA